MSTEWHDDATLIHTLKHVLDQYRALGDLLVNDELLIIGSDEENHVDLVRKSGIAG